VSDYIDRDVPGHGKVHFSISDEKPKEQTYPKTDMYQYQEFAGPVIEFGGYSDITMVDPYTGRRLWMGAEYDANDRPVTDNDTYAQITKLVALAKEIDFLGVNNQEAISGGEDE
jgi:hypothetical protein